jgi:hypothetical protein
LKISYGSLSKYLTGKHCAYKIRREVDSLAVFFPVIFERMVLALISRILCAAMAIMMTIFVILTGVAAAAGETAGYTLSVTRENPKASEEFDVIVHGDQLTDLYGYELQISYSTQQLRFVGASSLLGSGFSVTPIIQDGVVTYAYTKVGAATLGVSGSSDIASFKFRAVKTGESEIKLIRIKSVSGSKTSSVERPGTSTKIHIGSSVAIFFKDVPEGHWAKPAIDRASLLGFVNGYPDGTFKPNGAVTRAQYVTMLARALGMSVGTAASAIAFQDVDLIGEWAKPYVAGAAAEGWVKGFDDGTFRPDLPVTRAEMTVIAARAMKLAMDSAGQPVFADTDRIPEWAKPAVAAAAEAGLANGRGNNLFVPEETANRAEAVTLILRIIDFSSKS